jgi:hypothetical protein
MNLLERQETVLTKKRIETELRCAVVSNNAGQYGISSLSKLMRESGALEERGSKYGPFAQAAASYYVKRRINDINQNVDAGHRSYEFNSLALQVDYLDEFLSKRGDGYTSPIDKTAEAALVKTGGLSYYNHYGQRGHAVYFAPDNNFGTPQSTSAIYANDRTITNKPDCMMEGYQGNSYDGMGMGY